MPKAHVESQGTGLSSSGGAFVSAGHTFKACDTLQVAWLPTFITWCPPQTAAASTLLLGCGEAAHRLALYPPALANWNRDSLTA